MDPVSPPAIPSLESLVAEVADEFRERQRRGERPDVEEYAARHPHAADLLRRVLAAQLLFEPAAAGSVPPVVGDFRIVREAGRGAMGIVYEAEQLSLRGRRVALKILPVGPGMDPRRVRRFQNEASAAAGLNHPNIVPVYAVGQEGDRHYYAMQFIDGTSLDKVNARTGVLGTDEPTADSPGVAVPTDAAYHRRVAEWGVQAAEALEYAHGLGVIHRDVKPANLLVDARGKVWVTDFGLARLAADAGLTEPGDVLGTLWYVSPEQAQASHGLVDHRTDVYALGATLYHLVTGRPSVAGGTRPEILYHLAHSDPVAPRKLVPGLPRDLETILLKALEKAPADRYPTAGELARDLRLWLENRPIQAKPPTVFDRARKWAGRHPLAILSAVAMLLVLAAVSTVAAVLIWRQEHLAQQALAAADRRLALTRRAADDMYTQVAEKWLASQSGLQPKQREFLEKARALYEELAEETGNQPRARFDAAYAGKRLAAIEARLGRLDHAVAAYRRAIRTLEQLAREDPDERLYQHQLSETLSDLGEDLFRAGRLTEARETADRARSLAEQLVEWNPTEMNARRKLASALLTAWMVARAEKAAPPDRLRKLLERALQQHEKIVEAGDLIEYDKGVLGTVLGNLAITNMELANWAEVERLCLRRIDLYKELSAARREEPRYQEQLADAYRDLGSMSLPQQKKDGKPALREAARISQGLADRFPDVPAYRFGLAGCYLNLGNLLREAGDPPQPDGLDAEKAYRRAVDLSETAAADAPTVIEYRDAHLTALNNLCLLLDSKKADDLLEVGERLLRGREKLVGDFPKNAAYREALAKSREHIGVDYFNRAADLLSNPTPASLSSAKRLAARSTELMPEDADAWGLLGSVCHQQSDWRGVIAATDRFRKLNAARAGFALLDMARAYHRLGEKENAVACFREAQAWMEKHPPVPVELKELRDGIGALLGIKGSPRDTDP